MKTFIRHTTFLLTILILFAACKKGSEPQPELTSCTDCKFLFTENVDLASDYLFISGSYRLFWAELKKGPITKKVYIKAPMAGNSFTLTKADIIAGKVQVLDICPSCSMIGMKPVDGIVKGTRATPEATGKPRWLIDAKIIREPIDSKINYKDTVIVKQYFTAFYAVND